MCGARLRRFATTKLRFLSDAAKCNLKFLPAHLLFFSAPLFLSSLCLRFHVVSSVAMLVPVSAHSRACESALSSLRVRTREKMGVGATITSPRVICGMLRAATVHLMRFYWRKAVVCRDLFVTLCGKNYELHTFRPNETM